MSISKSSSKSHPNLKWRSTLLIKKITSIIDEIIAENISDRLNDELIKKQKKFTFQAKHLPVITLANFAERLLKYTHIEESTLVIALIYIDRVFELNKFILTSENIHRYNNLNNIGSFSPAF